MTQENVTRLTGENMGKAFAGFMKLPFDLPALLDIQTKNIEAISQAQMRVVEGWQAIALHQARLLSQAVEDGSDLLRKMATDCPLCSIREDKVEAIKSGCDDAFRNWWDAADIITTSCKAALDILNDRVTDSLAEFETATKTTGSESKKAVHKKAA